MGFWGDTHLFAPTALATYPYDISNSVTVKGTTTGLPIEDPTGWGDLEDHLFVAAGRNQVWVADALHVVVFKAP